MTEQSSPVTDEEKKRILNRLRRLEGQIRGLQSMISADQDCADILTQVTAAKSALNQVGLRIARYSMRRCLLASDGRSREDVVDEALALLFRFVELPDVGPAGD